MNDYELDLDNDQHTICITCNELLVDWELESGTLECFICECMGE